MKHVKIFFLFIIVLLSSCTEKDTQEQTVETIVAASIRANPVDSAAMQKGIIDTAVIELKNKSVSFLWSKTIFDPEINDSVSAIFINEKYCKTLSDAEKAAIAYVATFVGNDCMWDGDAADDRSNLKCRILTALNLGYQCSDTHLGYLRKWFKNDTYILERLADCPTIPNTATIQSTFEDIDVRTKKNKIWISYKTKTINLREGGWVEELCIDEFKLVNGTLKGGGITRSVQIYAIKEKNNKSSIKPLD